MRTETRFKPGKISALWEFLTTYLRQDQDLHNGVVTWQLWTGEPEDNTAVSYDELPALKLTPAAGSFAWTDETRYAGPLLLKLEIGVPSTRARDLFDFWEAVKNALAPTTALLGQLIPLGCYQLTMTGPAFEPFVFEGGQGLTARGSITLSLNVDISS